MDTTTTIILVIVGIFLVSIILCLAACFAVVGSPKAQKFLGNIMGKNAPGAGNKKRKG